MTINNSRGGYSHQVILPQSPPEELILISSSDSEETLSQNNAHIPSLYKRKYDQIDIDKIGDLAFKQMQKVEKDPGLICEQLQKKFKSIRLDVSNSTAEHPKPVENIEKDVPLQQSSLLTENTENIPERPKVKLRRTQPRIYTAESNDIAKQPTSTKDIERDAPKQQNILLTEDTGAISVRPKKKLHISTTNNYSTKEDPLPIKTETYVFEEAYRRAIETEREAIENLNKCLKQEREEDGTYKCWSIAELISQSDSVKIGQCSAAAKKGTRPTMQDTALVRHDTKTGLLGVFDGHGNTSAIAELLSEKFDSYFKIHFNSNLSAHQNNVSVALKNTFKDINEYIKANHLAFNGEAGSCAAVVHIGEKLTVACVGDCSVKVFRQGKAIPLSRPHNWSTDTQIAYDKDPRYVKYWENILNPKHFYMGGPGKAPGTGYRLNISSTVGDFALGDNISREPEIVVCNIKSEDVLLIESDGVSDYVTSEKEAGIIYSREGVESDDEATDHEGAFQEEHVYTLNKIENTRFLQKEFLQIIKANSAVLSAYIEKEVESLTHLDTDELIKLLDTITTEPELFPQSVVEKAHSLASHMESQQDLEKILQTIENDLNVLHKRMKDKKERSKAQQIVDLAHKKGGDDATAIVCSFI